MLSLFVYRAQRKMLYLIRCIVYKEKSIRKKRLGTQFYKLTSVLANIKALSKPVSVSNKLNTYLVWKVNRKVFFQYMEVRNSLFLTSLIHIWFEKLITKYFFQYMEVRNSKFAAFLDVFTPHTYICVVCPDSTVPTLLVSMNLKSAREHFENLEKSSTGGADKQLATGRWIRRGN